MSVPFSFPEVYQGFADAEGLIRLEHDTLILEYQIKDSMFGVIKSGLKSFTIQLHNIHAVEFSSNAFRAKMIVRPKSIQGLQEIPGVDTGKIDIRFARKYREEAQHLASQMNLKIAEARLEELEGNDGASELLP